MSTAASTLLESALALPEAERLVIAEALLASLPEDFVEVDDYVLEQELLRRSAEIDKDPSVIIPWSEVKRLTGQAEKS
jgi:putative addiction module component (TIGR02574 family)